MESLRQTLVGRMGEIYVLEMDEVSFSQKAKNAMGSYRIPVWYLTIIERRSGEALLLKLPRNSRSRDTIFGLVHRYISGDVEVHTDSNPVYTALDTMHQKHVVHRSCNHTLRFVNPRTGATINTAEGFHSHVKSFLARFRGIKIDYRELVIDEFMFKRKYGMDGKCMAKLVLCLYKYCVN